MHKVLRLPRQLQRGALRRPNAHRASPRQSKCCACHAKVAREMHRVLRLPRKCARSRSGDQTRTGLSKTVNVLRLPRKSTARCTECCACRVKMRAPATQTRTGKSQMQSKYCTCHAKVAREMHRVLRLPRKCARSPSGDQTRTRQVPDSQSAAPATQKYTSHAKVAPDAQSVAPATQLQPEPNGAQTRTNKSQTVKVLRLPRKSTARTKRAQASPSTKCCACHAKVAQMHKVLRLPRKCARIPPATKRAPASPRQSKCCACHAKVPRDAQSAAPATQMRAVPPATKRAPASPQTVKVLRLPRKSSSLDAQSVAPATQMRSGPSACHAPRESTRTAQVPDSQSAAPATQK